MLPIIRLDETRFEALSPVMKQVMTAYDALAYGLSSHKVEITQGIYFYMEHRNSRIGTKPGRTRSLRNTYQKNSRHCQVCLKGALFMSKFRLDGDHQYCPQDHSPNCIDMGFRDFKKDLNYFSDLSRMEDFFEGSNMNGTTLKGEREFFESYLHYLDREEVYPGYTYQEVRLIIILRNFIYNALHYTPRVEFTCHPHHGRKIKANRDPLKVYFEEGEEINIHML